MAIFHREFHSSHWHSHFFWLTNLQLRRDLQTGHFNGLFFLYVNERKSMNLLLYTARNSGVLPSLSLISVSAPFSINKLVVHLLPEKYFCKKMKTDRNECVLNIYLKMKINVVASIPEAGLLSWHQIRFLTFWKLLVSHLNTEFKI